MAPEQDLKRWEDHVMLLLDDELDLAMDNGASGSQSIWATTGEDQIKETMGPDKSKKRRPSKFMELEQAELQEQQKVKDQQQQQQWLHGAIAHSVAEAEGRAAAGH